MSYKLFLDDLRDVPMVYKNLTDDDFVIVRNFHDFKKVISENGLPELISFDNDLGLDENNNVAEDGYACSKWLVYESELDLRDLKFNVHSANPVASVQIQSLLDNYIKHLIENKKITKNITFKKMGLFDFFKKNKKTDISETEENLASSIKPSEKSLNEIYAEKHNSNNIENSDNLFDFIKIYSEYVVRFIGMQIQNNYAPIAAYEKNNGEIIGYLYIANDMSYNLSVEEVISNMEIEFEKRLNEKSIKSYVILYHSNFQDDNNHSISKKNDEFTAISIKYKTTDLKGNLGLRYFFNEDQISFGGISTFSREQNNLILNTELKEGKDYFQERVIIEEQIIENEIGLKIKKVNNGTVGDMWAGIFGFERLSTEEGRNFLIHHSAFVLIQEPVKSNSEILITEYGSDNVIFRGTKKVDETTRTVFPVIKTNNFIEVINKQINEWENVDNLEAIITGNGRDTFGLIYFATDYAINKEKYKSNKKLNIELSGIIYNLEICNMPNSTSEGPNYSEDFTMYMPNKEMSEFGCFDFIGLLEDFREINVPDNRPSKGYILKIKLITNPDILDFFTINMFVNKENMNFEDLKIGMKLTGLFQLQGQISE